MSTRTRSPNWLRAHARDVTSQTGEDGIIEKVLELLPDTDGWCVEFGAWDGRHLSNTYNLIANHGYSAVLIEADRSGSGGYRRRTAVTNA